MSKIFRSVLFVMITTSLVLAACGTPAPVATEAPAANTAAPDAPADTAASVAMADWATAKSVTDGGGMDALVASAKAEGELNVITLPKDWCNHGE